MHGFFCSCFQPGTLKCCIKKVAPHSFLSPSTTPKPRNRTGGDTPGGQSPGPRAASERFGPAGGCAVGGHES